MQGRVWFAFLVLVLSALLSGAAVAQTPRPGVGLQILPGAISCWIAAGDGTSGCAPMNLSCDPFPPSGVGDASDHTAFVCRYLGGVESRYGARPASGGAEGSFINAAPAIALAYRTGAPPPPGAAWTPGWVPIVNSDGMAYPTDRERTDVEFLSGSGSWIRQSWAAVDVTGESPESPRIVSRHSCDLWKTEPIYFVRAHPFTKRPQYWSQKDCRAGETSYSPARRDPDYGTSLPAYPQIYGPPAPPTDGGVTVPVLPPPVEPTPSPCAACPCPTCPSPPPCPVCPVCPSCPVCLPCPECRCPSLPIHKLSETTRATLIFLMRWSILGSERREMVREAVSEIESLVAGGMGLGARNRETLSQLSTWATIGGGRRQRIETLRAELVALESR